MHASIVAGRPRGEAPRPFAREMSPPVDVWGRCGSEARIRANRRLRGPGEACHRCPARTSVRSRPNRGPWWLKEGLLARQSLGGAVLVAVAVGGARGARASASSSDGRADASSAPWLVPSARGASRRCRCMPQSLLGDLVERRQGRLRARCRLRWTCGAGAARRRESEQTGGFEGPGRLATAAPHARACVLARTGALGG